MQKSMKIGKILGSFFLDSKGNLVLIQFPNAPLWAAILFYCIRFIPIQNTRVLMQISSWGMFFTLMYWSYLEITSGVTGFRRVLGLLVAASELYWLYQIIL